MRIITKYHMLLFLFFSLSTQALAQIPESSDFALLESSTEPNQDSGTNPPQNPLPKHDASAISARVDSLIDEPTNQKPPSEDRVDIIDYKRGKILGYMVLRNGNIIRRVLFKEPKDLHAPKSPFQHPATPQAHKPQESKPDSPESISKSTPPNTPRHQSPTEAYLSTTPSDKERAKSQDAKLSDKAMTPKLHKQNAASSSLPQEIGEESSRINKTYKNREWDKKKIPHDVQTRVIDIGH